MKFVSATDIGLMREENQDIVRVEEYYGNVLAVVCDGMGGERSGQDASRIAINEVFSRFSSGFSPALTLASASSTGMVYCLASATPSIRRMASECPWLTPLPQKV